MAKKDTEIYCRCIALGMTPAQALSEAGYKTDKPDSVRRQHDNLQKRAPIQNRIKELKQYFDDNPHLAKPITEPDDAKPAVQKQLSAKEYLLQTLNDVGQEPKLRLQAAMALLPYEEAKIAPKGKKEDAKDVAKTATTTGKFATMDYQADFFGVMN